MVDAILALPHEELTDELAVAETIRGMIEVFLGNFEQGRRHLRDGNERARVLPPVTYAAVLAYWVTLSRIGMYRPDDLVDEMRDVLRRAESFGDIFGIIAAQWAYGTALLYADKASHDEAIDVLERARANILKHRVFILALATINVDLAIEAVRNGRQPNEAIDELRAMLSLHLGGGSGVFVGCPGEALVELLVNRGTLDDLAEAHRIVDQWQAYRPGIPALDLWWLKSRALLTKAEGNADGHAKLAKQYLELCEKLDARGRLAEARRMVNELG